jgi:ribosomal protein S18 acetylase RimI-like enzyme
MAEETGPERVTSPVPISESPNSVATENSESSNQAEDGSPLAARQRQFVIVPEDQQLQAPSTLHPYTRPLTLSDLDSCIALENAAFSDPRDRASPEKFRYRLSRCGELCLGIFCTIEPGPGPKPATFATGNPVETSRKNGAICVLIGHVIASKTNDITASDNSMAVPEDWDSDHPKLTNLGHQEAGRTIALHSVAVLPEYQGRGIGRVLLMAYMQQMNGSGIADRLALIAHDHKTEWYEKLGFSNKGLGAAQFGSGGWYDLIFELKSLEARTTYG